VLAEEQRLCARSTSPRLRLVVSWTQHRRLHFLASRSIPPTEKLRNKIPLSHSSTALSSRTTCFTRNDNRGGHLYYRHCAVCLGRRNMQYSINCIDRGGRTTFLQSTCLIFIKINKQYLHVICPFFHNKYEWVDGISWNLVQMPQDITSFLHCTLWLCVFSNGRANFRGCIGTSATYCSLKFCVVLEFRRIFQYMWSYCFCRI
jgi:hypothetical protein